VAGGPPTATPRRSSKGFEYSDGSGAPPTITAVTLEGSDEVRIKLSAAPSANQPDKEIRYAYTGTPGANAGPTTGPRGNLRDSAPAIARPNAPLHNWAVHFSLPLP